MQKNWFLVSLTAAVGAVAVLGVAFVLPSNYALALLAVGVVTFVVVLLRNPAYRYWRAFVTLTSGWVLARAAPTALLRVKWGDDTLLDFWLSQEVGWSFDVVVGIIAVALMLADFFRDREKGVTRRLFSPSLFRFSFLRQVNTDSNAQQNVVGDVNGNNNNINFTQNNGLKADEVAQLMQAKPFDANAEIDAAAAQIAVSPDVAIHVLTEMRKKWHRLDPRERYRLLANLGHAHERRGEFAEAAKLYLEAREHQRDDPAARALEACGYVLLGETKRAGEMAEAILDDHPRCVRALVVRIRCAPCETSFSALEQLVPLGLRDDPEILFVLSQRAMQDGEFESAERLARQSYDKSPDAPMLQERLGAVIVQREGLADNRGTRPIDRARLHEAERLLTAALGKFVAKEDQARVRYTRAEAYGLLDEMEKAETDFRLTLECKPSDPDVIRRFAYLLDRRGRIAAAIDHLRGSIKSGVAASNRAILANLLMERNKGGDLTEAVQVIRNGISETCDEDSDHRDSLVELAVSALLRDRKPVEADKFLADLPAGYLSPPMRHAMRAKVLGGGGDGEKAREEARMAVKALGEAPSLDIRLHLIQVLTALGMPQEALGLWKGILTPQSSIEQVRYALQAADRAGEDAFILTFCEKLRAEGRSDPYCVELEVIKRMQYGPTEVAIGLMQQFVKNPTDEKLAKVFRARLSACGLEMDKPELVEYDPSKLPSVEEVSASLGPLVASVLKAGPDPMVGVRYAYELIRRHWDTPLVYETYLGIIGFGDGEIELPEVSEVGPGCAFRYRAEDTKEEKWAIFEDGPSPNADHEEFGADSFLIRKANGLRVGGKFLLREDFIQNREATVTVILSKYEYRKVYVLNELEDRFPEQKTIRKYTIPKNDDGSPDVVAFLRGLGRLEQSKDQLNTLYRDNSMSLTMFARLANEGLLASLARLVSDDSLIIRCCACTAEESQAAVEALRAATEVVIEPSALATLFLSDQYEKLAFMPFKCLVVESSLMEYRELQKKMSATSAGFNGQRNGMPIYHQDDPAAREREQKRLGTFLERIPLLATIVAGDALAEVPQTQRTTLIDTHRQPTAEAMAAGCAPGRVLWTDDFAVGLVARGQLNARRVWTQAVFLWLAEEGRIQATDATDLALWLTTSRYYFTRIDPATVLAACKAASWEPERPPLAAVINWFSSPDLMWEGVVQVGASALRLVWDSAVLVHQREVVGRALVRAILKRADGRELAVGIRESLALLFRLNAVAIEHYRNIINQELAGITLGGLVVPRPRLWRPGDPVE